MKNHRLLFIFTLLYFILGIINIHFSLLAMVCMTLPIILLYRTRKKTWCQGYCPRASLYTTCGKLKKWRSLNTPKFFIKGNMKWIMLIYFGISLTIIAISTIGVLRGRISPLEQLRYFILIPVPFSMPQIIDFTLPAPWLTHLSYRFYSMMMTTTTLGFVLGMIYKPRTWCTICPIATVSDVAIKHK